MLDKEKNPQELHKEVQELRQQYAKLEADLENTNAVNESFRNQVIILEYQFWSNVQDYSRETSEISGIPENIDDGELEGKVLTLLSKLHGNINPANVETCP